MGIPYVSHIRAYIHPFSWLHYRCPLFKQPEFVVGIFLSSFLAVSHFIVTTPVSICRIRRRLGGYLATI